MNFVLRSGEKIENSRFAYLYTKSFALFREICFPTKISLMGFRILVIAKSRYNETISRYSE